MIMKRLVLGDISELAEYMVGKIAEEFNVTATLFYDDAVALTRELMSYDDIEVGCLEIMTPEYNGYNKEYYVTLSEDNVLAVEPAWKDGRYLNAEPDLMLIDGDASHQIVADTPIGNCRELYIGIDEDDETDCCGECCCDCSSCDKKSDDDALDELLENTKLIYDDNKNVVGFSMNAEQLFKYLFS